MSRDDRDGDATLPTDTAPPESQGQRDTREQREQRESRESPRERDDREQREEREAAARLAERRMRDRRGVEAKRAGLRETIRGELDENTDAQGGTIVGLERVSLAFDRPILQDVSLDVREGETVVVLGESGTGKSTLLKLVLRLLVPDEGRVLIEGQDITELSFADALEVRGKMGMVFQGAALFDSMSVYENVAYPLREHTELDEDAIEARVRETLEFVDLEPDRVMSQLPASLSGGMRKRVGIARGLANDARIMLYDEPTSGLDPLTTGTITRLIMKLQRELRVTSVVVSHDIRSSFRMASRVVLLADCRFAFVGTPEEMTASDDPYIRDFLGGL